MGSASSSAWPVTRLSPRSCRDRQPVAQRAPTTVVPPFAEGFLPQEQEWIDQVWHHPGMQLMFQVYGELPTPVLARVKETIENGVPSSTTEGVTHNEPETGQPDIEIADATYSETMAVEPQEGDSRQATEEEEFKATLIHELFHFVENNTKHIDPEAIPTPETLKAVLAEPRLEGLPAFAFGWIKRGTVVVHLSDVGILKEGETDEGLRDETEWITAGSPEAKAKRDKAYEQSPDSRGLEEDLATSIAMYLTGMDLRVHLLRQYPMRFALVDSYFKNLVKIARASAG